MACYEAPFEIYREDTGFWIQGRILDETDATIDLQTADVKQIKIKKPDGAVFIDTIVFLSDGSDGIVRYQIVDSSITDQVGIYCYQFYIAMTASDFKRHTDPSNFTVKEHM